LPRFGHGVTQRQVEGVRWIGDGCLDGVMVEETGPSRSRLVPSQLWISPRSELRLPVAVLAVTKSMGDARGHVVSGGSLSER
jgi:hypothetical protein